MIPFAFAKLLEGSGLEVKEKERDGVVILDLEGRLVLGEEELALRQRIESLVEGGARKLILNLKDISEIDSTGLATLEFCAEKFRAAGGKCVLLNLDPAHTDPADVLKLSTLFETFQDESDAVNSFFPERIVPRYDILEFVASLNHHDTVQR